MLTSLLGAWPVSEVNNFAGEYQEKNNHVIQYYRPITKEISTSK